MRNKVDNTALEDIYTHFDEAEIEPTITEPESAQVPPESESEPQSESSSPEEQ